MSVLLCFATALMLFVLFLSYRKRHLQVARTMVYMITAASCYALGYAFEILSVTLDGVKLSLQFEYLGIPFVSAFWLLMVIQFTGLAAPYRKWFALLLFLIPSVTFLLHLTNEWHHLVYEGYFPNPNDTVPLYNTLKGPWYAVHGVYNYTILLLGILLFIPMYIRALPIVRKQIVLLILGAAAPMLFNIGYMFNTIIDFTPLGFAVSGVVYAWGIFRFGLFRLTPLAYAKMFDTVRDGVVLLDYDNQIVNHNRAAEEVFPQLMQIESFPAFDKEIDIASDGVFQEIRRQVRGTFHLVDNLLDWYRSQNGEVAFRPQAWNLQQVVRQALSLAGARAAMKNIQISELVDEKLTVNADKEMLDLIFRNLLSNANIRISMERSRSAPLLSIMR